MPANAEQLADGMTSLGKQPAAIKLYQIHIHCKVGTTATDEVPCHMRPEGSGVWNQNNEGDKAD